MIEEIGLIEVENGFRISTEMVNIEVKAVVEEVVMETFETMEDLFLRKTWSS